MTAPVERSFNLPTGSVAPHRRGAWVFGAVIDIQTFTEPRYIREGDANIGFACYDIMEMGGTLEDGHGADAWDVSLTPAQAREIADALIAAADYLDAH